MNVILTYVALVRHSWKTKKLKYCSWKILKMFLISVVSLGREAVLQSTQKINWVSWSGMGSKNVGRKPFWVLWRYSMELNCLIICIYRRPNSNLDIFFVNLELLLIKLVARPRNSYKNIFVLGDFNVNILENNKKVNCF